MAIVISFKDIDGKEINIGDKVRHVRCCSKHEGSMKEEVVSIRGNRIYPFQDSDQGETYQISTNYKLIE